MVLIINILMRLREQVITQWDGIKEMRCVDKSVPGSPQKGLCTAEGINPGTG